MNQSRPGPAALAALIALALVVAGCGGGDAPPPGVVRVDFWHAMSGPLKKPLDRLIRRFEEQNPDVQVRSIYQGGYAQLSQKIRFAVQSQDPPVLAQMYEAAVAFNNRDRQIVQPLDAFLTRDAAEVDWQDVFEPFRETARVGDGTYVLPLIKSFPVLYYNKRLLREAGLPGPPTTWDEFAEYGRKLTKDADGDGTPEQWGWAFVTDPWIFECMVLQYGGSFLKPDGTSALGGRPAVEAMRFLVDASQGEGRFAYRSTGYDHQLDFADERVAMILASTVSRTFMADQLTFDVGVVPIPQGPHRASIMSGAGVAMFADHPPAVKDAAWRFLKYLASSKATLYWGISTNYIPIRESATQSEDYQKRIEADPGFGAGVAQLAYATSEPPLTSWYECRQVLARAMERVLIDPARAEAIFQEAVQEMNRTLAQEQGPRGHEG